MLFQYSVEIKTNTVIKTYIAEITGEHEKYRFKRRFLPIAHMGCNDRIFYETKLVGHGVFELSSKRFDVQTGKMLGFEKEYFVYYHRKLYFIERDEVLLAKMYLNAHYKANGRGVCHRLSKVRICEITSDERNRGVDGI